MIHLEDIHKSFDGQKVLDGLSLHIPRGKITVLLGRSGSGKSVTLKHLIGLVRPDRGRVLVDGRDITRMSGSDLNRTRLKFGMLFQEAALFDSMTVWENIAFPLLEHTDLSRKEIAEKVDQQLDRMQLEGAEKKLPAHLSGGMKKRVGLARAMIMKPEIILYDEPTSGLDPIMADAINRLIVRTQKQAEVTSFIISHDVDSALALADKVAVLFKGRLLMEGTPQEIKASDDRFVKQFLAKSSTGPMAEEEG